MAMDIGAIIAWKYPNLASGWDYSVVVNPSTGQQSIEFWKAQGIAQPTQTDLNNWWIPCLQQLKINSLRNSCSQTILSGFTSNALGAVYTYDCDPESQRNLIGTMLKMTNDSTITSISWKTIENGYTNHTRAQFQQVFADGFNFIENNRYKYRDKKAQVLAATTEGEINAITW